MKSHASVNFNYFCTLDERMQIWIIRVAYSDAYFGGLCHMSQRKHHILPCIMRSCVQCTPIFLAQTYRKKIFCLNFLIQFYLFIFRNKTDYHIPGYYSAYGHHYCSLELQF